MSVDRNRSSTVLVTGATGALGPSVVQSLYESGYRVRSFTRNRPQPGLLPRDVDIHIGDITDLNAVETAVRDCCAVVHMAALLHIANPTPELHYQYKQINVQGTKNVLFAAERLGLDRVVYLSTIAVYGPSNHQILTEESQPRPNTVYGRTKLEAENLVLQAKSNAGMPMGVVLRLGAVYGARIKGNYGRLVQALAKGTFIPVGSCHNRRSLIYDKDVARAIRLALEDPKAIGRIYNVTDGEFHEIGDIVESICFALGRKPPKLRLPVVPAQAAASTIDRLSRIILRRQSNIYNTIDKLTEDIAVDSHRIQNDLGFSPVYDLSKGWQETIDEFHRTETNP